MLWLLWLDSSSISISLSQSPSSREQACQQEWQTMSTQRRSTSPQHFRVPSPWAHLHWRHHCTPHPLPPPPPSPPPTTCLHHSPWPSSHHLLRRTHRASPHLRALQLLFSLMLINTAHQPFTMRQTFLPPSSHCFLPLQPPAYRALFTRREMSQCSISITTRHHSVWPPLPSC